MRRFLIPLLLLTLAGALVVSTRDVRPPSILLITIDTLRADRLGAYGHPTNNTPAIDRLAKEGVIFERAYCDMPWTTGSMASVMTGQYSNEHGLRDPTSKINPDIVTLAQMLQSKGAQTAAIVGSFPLDSVYGLDRGFETYDDEFTMPVLQDSSAPVRSVSGDLPDDWDEQTAFVQEKQENDWYRPDEDVTDAAIEWLDTSRDGRPFFLWVHYFGPHEKYDRTRRLFDQEREVVAAYDGDVQKNDRAVGRLLDHLRTIGLIDETVVILHADHGQNLGENDYVGHTLRLDEVAVRIPMIIRYPSLFRGGTRRNDIARNVDILPTVMSAWGSPVEGMAGRSLIPVRDDHDGLQVPSAAQIAYFETYLTLFYFWPQTTSDLGTILGPMVSQGVRTPEWKMLRNEFRGECDWGAMPLRDGNGTWVVRSPRKLPAARCAEIGAKEVYQQTMLSPHDLKRVDNPSAEVISLLTTEIEKHRDRPHGPGSQKFDLSPEQEEKLRSLGYLR